VVLAQVGKCLAESCRERRDSDVEDLLLNTLIWGCIGSRRKATIEESR
jgi:hypothetical protein